MNFVVVVGVVVGIAVGIAAVVVDIAAGIAVVVDFGVVVVVVAFVGIVVVEGFGVEENTWDSVVVVVVAVDLWGGKEKTVCYLPSEASEAGSLRKWLSVSLEKSWRDEGRSRGKSHLE